MWTAETLALVGAAFLLAGFVKGVVGLGLPTVALAVLTATIGHKTGIALMLVPSLVTNIWQALAGDAFGTILRRLWPLLAAACVGTWFGAGILATADAAVLTGTLGLMLCLYAAVSLAAKQIPPPGRFESRISPAVGIVTGVVTGMTGTFVVPGVLYLQTLGLPREMLVQAMGIAFTVATVALAVALAGHALLPIELGALSAAAVVPTVLGMVVGTRLRRRLSERLFRRVFFSALLALGAYIAGSAIFY